MQNNTNEKEVFLKYRKYFWKYKKSDHWTTKFWNLYGIIYNQILSKTKLEETIG